ncbi:MAG: glutaminase [Oscillatoriaceae bacterium SKW80]|nr:glutaminase [Oscillatoriaceae bacterium SKYG93]MCX8121760.1 glutaminase [Oscillatoriaceae bacterium SKW80]MDW8453623.1 glutaminase [Oscillatoriaceae cyanobacterium SKYGB_i_bin93]HIK28688.1 glutaminase [Oscillatoriaceae cyanobacterium M7585_C2015_266]
MMKKEELKKQLEKWVIQAKAASIQGRLPDYIPKLAAANPAAFAWQIKSVDGESIILGDASISFCLMSVIKPFVLFYLLLEIGAEKVFKRVGTEPSEEAFNSLSQLKADKGWPRNPMINSGALALAAMLPGKDAASRCENLRCWLNLQANSQLILDESMLDSVRSVPNQNNRAIAYELQASGYIEDAEIALDTYNHICCLSGKIEDLTRLGMLLIKYPDSNWEDSAKTVKTLMTTCGLYQASKRFAEKVGLPTKSGVSGAMLSIAGERAIIACYSPPLDAEGNSVAGLFLLEILAKKWGELII